MSVSDEFTEAFAVVVMLAGLALMGGPMVVDIYGDLSTSVWVYWGIGLAVMFSASL